LSIIRDGDTETFLWIAVRIGPGEQKFANACPDYVERPRSSSALAQGVRQPAGARCGKPTTGNTHPDHANGADSAIRLVALVLGINAAADDPCCYPHGAALPALRVDRHTPSPVIGRPAASMRGNLGMSAARIEPAHGTEAGAIPGCQHPSFSRRVMVL